ncbi:MAG: hypothetical protein WAM66_15270 [Acidobacteriaceae bacterium]
MPRIRSYAKAALPLVLAALCFAMLPVARAQYVGRVDTSKNSGPTLRATAVLEYTGSLTKPTASRLVPIAVWDGERYEPGGLYLAQPVPLTVQTGTQYVLEKAGTPKGLFDVKAAADINGSWMAIGSYQKPAPPKYAKLKRSRHLPLIMDDEKPHFAHVPTGDTKVGATTAANSSAPPVDPDRPTLHQRPSDESAPSGDTAQTNPAPPIDPDRPILREPTKATAQSQAQSQASGSEPAETATTAVDPNRPHLEYGRPAEQESLGAPSKVIATLAGTPEDLKQIAAVSDAVTRPPHSYVYSWSSPEDEKQMKAKVEAIAQGLLAASEPKPATTAAKPRSRRRTASRRATKPALPALTGEQFKSYELSYGGGATLVFSATEGQGDAARYIMLIAQPDFNGTPIVLFKRITAQRDLSIVPRMKLIDAVDTNADNRAELIFALETQTGRQYAIYSVANGTAEQVFSTGG